MPVTNMWVLNAATKHTFNDLFPGNYMLSGTIEAGIIS